MLRRAQAVLLWSAESDDLQVVIKEPSSGELHPRVTAPSAQPPGRRRRRWCCCCCCFCCCCCKSALIRPQPRPRPLEPPPRPATGGADYSSAAAVKSIQSRALAHALFDSCVSAGGSGWPWVVSTTAMLHGFGVEPPGYVAPHATPPHAGTLVLPPCCRRQRRFGWHLQRGWPSPMRKVPMWPPVCPQQPNWCTNRQARVSSLLWRCGSSMQQGTRARALCRRFHFWAGWTFPVGVLARQTPFCGPRWL
jgi:hypothetical protein